MTAAAWPVCTICYEDLRPLSDQHLHCLPACGHVFHALCLEQWLEYCPGGKKKRTCPVCKQPCGAAHPPTRLYFQSTGACPTQADPTSQDAPGGPDPEALATELARLEQKASSLGRVVEEQRDGIKNLNAEVARLMAKAATAEAMQEAARKEKECVQMLLNARTEELLRKTSECGRLQEKSLALAKELAALKLSSDMNLQEEEILKLASLGNHGNLENAVDVLKRSLAIRNKSYKELMIQCNVLGRSESRMQQKVEKAKELVKKLKARVQELEKELEEKENSLIRDLRPSKKLKADQTKSGNITANDGFPCPSAGNRNQTTKLDEVMQDSCNDKLDLNRLKPEAKSDLNSNGNFENKNADVIELDADDSAFGNEHKTQLSARPFGTDDNTLDSQNKSSLCQNDNRQTMAFECTITHVAKEASFLKNREATGKSTSLENLRAKLHIPQDTLFERTNMTTSTWEKETLTIDGISKQATRLTSGTGPQQVHNFNSLSDDFQSPGVPGMDGARKSIGKWCKSSTAPGSAAANPNRGSLIAVGPDGRGGNVKILRDLGRFQDSKSQALWPKAPKVGSKGGQSQIDHFFGKR
ncbi:hypothetical protein PAHAL_6G032700 [Panicum hallii]|uniref:RING-type domain-containing protein n=1 Tax=Panicum hallii TaxID=206008 RepID=A0A2S3I055_9POAL|nr:uncharacterized protein LOC112897292 [Panicum hallii]PAN33603.1 hypothetical protein PAHAL_6G032700 [Panicum hallii]